MNKNIAIIGAGPAGLMAAEMLSNAGIKVDVYDAMPSVGRKFLLAGLGGLNLTHAEPFDHFVTRYGDRADVCTQWLKAFDADAIREWVKVLGLDTFVGTSQRVFPTDMKAAPLLRAWLHRLRHPSQSSLPSGNDNDNDNGNILQPVTFHMRHRWNGGLTRTDQGFTLSFDTPHNQQTVHAKVVLLALGGGSWRKLGSDGAWQGWLQTSGVDVAPLRPANCGFDVSDWSAHMASQFAGAPLKSVALSFVDSQGHTFNRRGEFVVTANGIEGSLVYAASALLRDEIERIGTATLHLDLKPDFTAERVLAEVSHPRGSRSLSSHLKSRLNLTPLHLALLHEVLSKDAMNDAHQLSIAIKHLPITLNATRPLDEAISSAGGVKLESLTEQLMARDCPGLFFAGEMLDWEAPTGGYLLSACLASGRAAGAGAAAYLKPL